MHEHDYSQIFAENTVMLKKITFVTFILLSTCILFAQENRRSKEQRKSIRKAEHKLDKSYGGMGLTMSSPMFSEHTETNDAWMEANALFDIMEFKYGFGKLQLTDSFSQRHDLQGTHYYAGVNVPITWGAFGRQKNSWLSYRFHPVIAGGFGVYTFKENVNKAFNKFDNVWYFGFNPGVRFRFPFGSIEANLNMNIDMGKKAKFAIDGIHKRFAFFPSFTLRMDALKWYYNPQKVRVTGTQTSTENYQSTSYVSGNYRYTYTTYDIVVRPITMGIMDIGFHVGVGPKISFMNPQRSTYIPTSNLLGVTCEGRYAMFDFSLTAEGGTIGHGGLLVTKGSGDDLKYRKKLVKTETTGLGTMKNFSFYGQAGIDITSFILALGGISISKGSATSYLGLTAGVNFGMHYSWDQQFVNPADAQMYDERLVQDNQQSKAKFIDPREVGFGYLGGFYISMQVGSMNFKITNYRYYGAPFASTTMCSLAYRFPVYRANK